MPRTESRRENESGYTNVKKNSLMAGPPPTGPREARPDDRLRGVTRPSSKLASLAGCAGQARA
jgi:hypothetical protein